MDSPDKVCISLTRPALERLLGNDTEVEVKLRQQVVNEFSKRHLKELVTAAGGEELRKVAAAVAAEVKSAIGTQLWDERTGHFHASIATKVRELIGFKFDLAIQGIVQKEITGRAEHWVKQFEDTVQRYEGRMIALAEKKAREVLDGIPALAEKKMAEAFERRVSEECLRRLKLAGELGGPGASAGITPVPPQSPPAP